MERERGGKRRVEGGGKGIRKGGMGYCGREEEVSVREKGRGMGGGGSEKRRVVEKEESWGREGSCGGRVEG